MRHTLPAALNPCPERGGLCFRDHTGAGALSAFLGRKYQKGALVSGFLRGLRTVVLYLGSPPLDLWCHLGGGGARRQAGSSLRGLGFSVESSAGDPGAEPAFQALQATPLSWV